MNRQWSEGVTCTESKTAWVYLQPTAQTWGVTFLKHPACQTQLGDNRPDPVRQQLPSWTATLPSLTWAINGLRDLMVWIPLLCELKISWPRCFWKPVGKVAPKGDWEETRPLEQGLLSKVNCKGLGMGSCLGMAPKHTARPPGLLQLSDGNSMHLNTLVLMTQLIRPRKWLEGSPPAAAQPRAEAGRTPPVAESQLQVTPTVLSSAPAHSAGPHHTCP